MRVLIIEDEPASAQRLKKMIEEIDPEMKVVEILDSITSSVSWLKGHSEPDLAFFDIHLADGLSFEIFSETEVRCPVIFTTAYDQYAIQAFKVNSIDYLLKPVKKEELAEAIRKYRRLKSPAAVVDMSMLASLLNRNSREYLKRIMIRIGQHLKVFDIKDLAYFYIEEKIVFALTAKGDRYPVDFSLDELEGLLDPSRFFRINRGFIISFESIDTMVAYSKSRIKIKLKPPCTEESISSTERSPLFKDWLKGK